MRAYVTSVGEKTTQICCEQLEKFGFDVVLLDDLATWSIKYSRFIENTEEDCIRVDADVIVNKNIEGANYFSTVPDLLMAQFQVYDFYQNDILIGQPVFYSKNVFKIIRERIRFMDETRPETWAWRLPEINPRTFNIGGIVGIHGFFQDQKTMDRAEQNKINRKQIERYDFDLVHKITSL